MSTEPNTPSEGPSSTEPTLHDRVAKVIGEVRPYLQADGGDCELVDVTPEGVVRLRLQGACSTCPSATYTLQMGIQTRLQEAIPEITGVVAV